MALIIPNRVYRISKREDAAHASDMACRKFFLIRAMRFSLGVGACIYTSYEFAPSPAKGQET